MAEERKLKLSVKNLTINFKTDHGLLQAVRDVSFDLYEGETLCIVGESGSGKSVTSKAIMGLLANNAIVESGQIMFEGENLLEVSEDQFYKIRGHKIGMIFQDPLSSLNPIVKIGKQITETTLINSDKLKLMYEDLISKELIEYKNVLAKKNIDIKHYYNEYMKVVGNCNMELKGSDTKVTPERKSELKLKMSTAHKEYVDHKKAITLEAKEKAKPLLEALNAKKAYAKEEVKKYKASVLAKYNAEKAEISSKLSDANTSYEESIELKKKLNDIKLERDNSLKISKAEAKRRALEVMREVGIPQPERRFNQYPFEFSGGMRQRIVIAIALTTAPEILICDEPTTALDVTIQGQILELIKKIQKERNISVIFITHDLGVVANMADSVAVMYAGKIVEYGLVNEIFYEPKHPYTWALLSSIPDIDSKERLESIPGTPPNMIYPPKGDAFALRSKYAMNIDFEAQPPFFKVSDTHYAATWLLHPNAPKVEMPRIVSERIKRDTKDLKKTTTKKSKKGVDDNGKE